MILSRLLPLSRPGQENHTGEANLDSLNLGEELIPHIIHFTVPARTTPAQERAIARARELHPDWQLNVWRDPVPADGLRLAALWPNTNSGAQLADLIRLDVVNAYGGIYLDSDIMLQRPLDNIAAHCDFFICSEDGNLATNAVFGAVAKHAVTTDLIENLIAFPPDWTLPPNETTGSEFFSRNLKWREDVTILPRGTFYPYNWDSAREKRHAAAYGAHEWAGTRLSKTQRNTTDMLRDKATKFKFKYRPSALLSKTLGKILNKLPKSSGYRSGNYLVTRTVYGHYLLLCSDDLSISPEIYFNGFYERGEENFVRDALRGGDFFVDVGANIGAFSILAAMKVGPFGRVYAYEPSPVPAEAIVKSAVMNWVHERVIVRKVGVSHKSGTAELSVNLSRLGDATMIVGATGGAYDKSRAVLGSTDKIPIDMVCLNEEFPYDVHIRVLKIDAEGYEPEVLKGAWRLIENGCIDFIIMEAVQEVAGSSWPRLMNTVEALITAGYQPYRTLQDGSLVDSSLTKVKLGKHGSRNVIFKHTNASLPPKSE
jgi:FkbM family methyltransferase